MNLSKKDYIWSYLGFFLKFGSSLMLTPFTLIFLSTHELGLWYTFASTSSIAYLLDLGFGQNFSRNFVYAWSGCTELKKEGVEIISEEISGKPNKKLFVILLRSSAYIYFRISIIALLLLLLLGVPYINYIMSNYDNNYVVQWIIYSFAIFINLLYSYKFGALEGAGYIAESQKSITVGKISNVIISILFLKLGFGLYSLCVGFLVDIIVSRIMISFYINQKVINYKEFRVLKSEVSLKEILETIKILSFNARKTAIVTLSNTLMGQLSTLICSGVIGVDATASFGLCNQLISIINSVASINHQTNMPVYSNLWIDGRKDKIKRVYSFSILIFITIWIFGIASLVTIGIPIIKLIKPNIDLPFFVVLIMSLTGMVEGYYTLNINFIVTKNRIPYVLSNFTSLCVMILFYIITLKFMNLGIYALILGKTIAQSLYNYWKWNKFALQEADLTLKACIIMGVNEMFKNLNMGKLLKIRKD